MRSGQALFESDGGKMMAVGRLQSNLAFHHHPAATSNHDFAAPLNCLPSEPSTAALGRSSYRYNSQKTKAGLIQTYKSLHCAAQQQS